MKYRASTSHGFTFESLDSRMYSRMLIAATISSDAIISSFLGKLESRKASAKRRRSPIDVSRRSSRATRSLKIFSGWSEESKVKLNVGDRRWSSRWFKEKTRERAMHASAIAGVGGGGGGRAGRVKKSRGSVYRLEMTELAGEQWLLLASKCRLAIDIYRRQATPRPSYTR